MTINVTLRFNSRTDVLRYLIKLNKFDQITCFWHISCRKITKCLFLNADNAKPRVIVGWKAGFPSQKEVREARGL